MGLVVLHPPIDGWEQYAIRSIITRRETREAARMTVNFHQCQALPGSVGQRRQEHLCAPGDLHRGAHLAVVIGHRHDLLDHEAMTGLSSAAPAQSDRHDFLAIAWEEKRPQLYVLC